MRYTILAAALASTAVPVTLSAQTVVSAPTSMLIRQVDIPHERFTLANGLTVLVHTDRSAPIVTVQVWYNVGSKDEPNGRSGFAHLFEHLMFGGSENATGAFAEVMNGLGASDLNGTTWFDRTNYYETVPTSALARALYMESDRMGYLLGALGQETLDLQRGVVQNEKRQGENSPGGLVFVEQLKAMLPAGHPYAHSTIGSMDDLDRADMATVRAWFRDRYAPNNAVLALAGDIDAGTARALVERYFGGIARGPVNTPAMAAVVPLKAPVKIVMHDRVPTAELRRSWVIPGMLDPDTPSLTVGARILGRGPASRLDRSLVRDTQVALDAGASIMALHRLGFFDAHATATPGQDPEETGRRLDAAIADFIARGPTQEEVDRVVTDLAAGMIRAMESPEAKATMLAEGQLYAGDPGFYKTELAAYAAVTPQSVKAAMSKWLSHPAWSLTLLPGSRPAYREAAARPAGATRKAAAIARVKRDPAPAVGPVSALRFPDVERMRLSNGITVTYARRATVPLTQLQIEFDAGGAADTAATAGLQNLMVSLMQEGSGGLDAIQFREAQERLGTSIGVDADRDRSTVSLDSLSVNLGPSLALAAGMIERPAFDPRDLDRAKASAATAIEGEKKSAGILAAHTLSRLMYRPTHPYARPVIGDRASIGALTRENVIAAHAAWIRPDNARIFVVSDLPLHQLAPMLEASIGRWRAPASPRGVKTFDTAHPAATKRIVLVDLPQSPQSVVFGGQALPAGASGDRLMLDMANKAIGDGFSARLNMDLRETKGWSYGASGRIEDREHGALYVAGAPVQADRTADALVAMMAQYRDFLTTRGVTAAERQRIVEESTRSLVADYQTVGAVLDALVENDRQGRADDYQQTLAGRILALTPAALDAAARAALDPDAFTWVIVGDAALVKPQLDRLHLAYEIQKAD